VVWRTLAAVALTTCFLFPIYWLFMISFKTPEEIFAFPPRWWPSHIQFDNYAVLFKDGDAVTVWNSLVVASASTVLAMLLGTLCAYSLARFRTGGVHLSHGRRQPCLPAAIQLAPTAVAVTTCMGSSVFFPEQQQRHAGVT